MLNIKKILLPVDFPNTSLRVIHQAATLAHQFRSEIVMLHVLTMLSQAAGVPTDGGKHSGWDLVAEIIREAQKNLDHSLGPALEGIPIERLLVKGDAAEAILETAQQEKADLIMMPSYGYAFDQFLVGSIARKMLKWTDCLPGLDPTAASKNYLRSSLRSATFCARSISSRIATRVCRGRCRSRPNLARA